MKLAVKNGVTSLVLRVLILDSASTTGAGKTGLTSASSGLIISTIADNEATPTVYAVASSNVETITTLGTFAAPTASKCRFKEVDSSNHPGLYELHIADARWAVSNARSVIVTISGASGAAQVSLEIQLEEVPSDIRKLLGTAWLTPAVAGTPDVNAKQVGGTAWSSADLSATMKASVNTEADTALTDYGALKPTVAGRTLDVSVGGEAGIDWANVGSPTTTVALTGTTITLVSGSITSSTFSAGAITASSIAADAIGASKLAADAVAEIADAVWDEVLSGHLTGETTGAGLNAAGSAGDPWSTALPGAYSAGTAGYIVGTNLDAIVSSRSTYAGADTSGTTTLLSRLSATRAGYLDNLSGGAVALASGVTVTTMGAGVITASSIAADAIGASELAADAVAEIADAVWDEVLSGHLTGGTTGAGLNAAGSAGDPWGTAVPGAYSAGSAGYVVGTFITGNTYTRLGDPVGVSIAADIAAVQSDTTTLLARITSTLFSGITSLAQWLGALAGKQTANSTARTEIRATGAGSGTYSETTDSLEAVRDRGDAAWVTGGGGGGGTGSGAYTLTITVDDGTDPLQNASVRLTEGVTDLIDTTDVNGKVVFSVDAATWDVAITKDGYQFTPTTLAVSASDSVTYSMTQVAVTPNPDPDKSTVIVTCYGADTEVEPGATLYVRQITAPSGDEDHAYSGAEIEYTADGSGVVTLTLWAGAKYEVHRGDKRWLQTITPAAGTDSLSSFVGRST